MHKPGAVKRWILLSPRKTGNWTGEGRPRPFQRHTRSLRPSRGNYAAAFEDRMANRFSSCSIANCSKPSSARFRREASGPPVCGHRPEFVSNAESIKGRAIARKYPRIWAADQSPPARSSCAVTPSTHWRAARAAILSNSADRVEDRNRLLSPFHDRRKSMAEIPKNVRLMRKRRKILFQRRIRNRAKHNAIFNRIPIFLSKRFGGQ
jgi:hypothetical protein